MEASGRDMRDATRKFAMMKYAARRSSRGRRLSRVRSPALEFHLSNVNYHENRVPRDHAVLIHLFENINVVTLTIVSR